MSVNQDAVSGIAAVRQAIQKCTHPLICAHVRLDGDALGCEVALLHILRQLGKSPHAVNDGHIPQAFRFLPGIDGVGVGVEALTYNYDAVIIVDAGAIYRLGKIGEALPRDVPLICIDHHPPEEEFPGVAWIDPARSSAGEMVYRLARESRWPIPRDAATALLMSIMTDTGRFTFSNTGADALRSAAELLDLGADHIAVTRNVYSSEPLNLIRLRGEVMDSFRLQLQDRVCVARVTLAMLEHNNVHPVDTQDFADMPRSVAGVEVGVLLREMNGGKIKISLRSNGRVDVAAVAKMFDGGGHVAAAGGEAPGTIDEVEQRVLGELAKRL
jgi:bifunctional oligoribonuclease and PAP phosphatase NrnA